MTRLEFWHEFASTYSYLAAMRIEDLARESGVEVVWRPFLLGPIFVKQGWTSSPFNLYPAKGRHMWRDMARRAAQRGLPLVQPEPFPQNSLMAARLMLAGLEADWGPRFARLVYLAEFGQGLDISEDGILGPLVAEAGGDPQAAMLRARSDEIKARLRDATAEAEAKGIFGAPSFVVGDELFWGDDRLEDAISWARDAHPLQLSGGAAALAAIRS
jgi:2-hydroxychromene-2-carboxylate isomerase